MSLLGSGLAVLVVACSADEESPAAMDAGALSDVTTTADDAASDAGADATTAPTCKEGRRRCTGSNLELCDDGGWGLLQSCLAGEWCDVAVGICRAVDAGPDSGPDAG